MSRQNPRRPTQPPGDNPAGRTRGFNFKIVSDPLSTPGTTTSIASSVPTALPSATSLGHSHHQVGATPLSAAGAQLQTASSSAAQDFNLIGRGSVVPAESVYHVSGALPRTPIEPRDHHEFPGGGYQRSNPGGFSPARQVRDSSLHPRAHHSFDLPLDQPQHAADQNVLQVLDLCQFSGPARDMDTAPQAPAPQNGIPSSATSPDRVQMRLDAMYAEERRVDAIKEAKQRDLQALHDQMRAEEDRAGRECERQRDLDALQAEADRLDKEHRSRLLHFQREERDLETQLARGGIQDERIQPSPRTQYQREYPSRLPPQTARPSIASASAPSAYQLAPKPRRGARFSQRQQSRGSSRSQTPLDSVAPSPPQRVQSLLPIDRGPPSGAPQPFPRFGSPQDHRLPQSEYYTTTVSAARLDRHERSPFEPYKRGDSYQQQFQQASRDWELAPKRTTLPPVDDYLAASPSTDLPREQLDDEIELPSAQLERAKALKAAAAA